MRELIQKLHKEAFFMPRYPDESFPLSYYYNFLKLLCIHVKPKLCVELGAAGGGASLYMAWGWPKGLVVGVDTAWDYPDRIMYLVRNFPNFHFMQGDSIDLAETIYNLFGPIDILFIDTIHTYERTMDEFNTYLPYLADNYFVCLDDLYREGMDKAWAELPGDKHRLDYLHPPVIGEGEQYGDGGYGVITRKENPHVFFDYSSNRFMLQED